MGKALTILVVMTIFGACGASPRRQYLGNRYFEYCHRADLEQSASDAALARCWHAWLEHYTVGQSAERVAHAKEREMTLRGGEALRLSLPEDTGSQPNPHSEAERSLDCNGLCDNSRERCTARCASLASETETSDTVNDDKLETLSTRSCLPACEQEFRVCKQGCL